MGVVLICTHPEDSSDNENMMHLDLIVSTSLWWRENPLMRELPLPVVRQLLTMVLREIPLRPSWVNNLLKQIN